MKTVRIDYFKLTGYFEFLPEVDTKTYELIPISTKMKKLYDLIIDLNSQYDDYICPEQKLRILCPVYKVNDINKFLEFCLKYSNVIVDEKTYEMNKFII